MRGPGRPFRFFPVALFAVLLLAACTGSAVDDGGGDGSPATPERTTPEAEATPSGPQRSFALGFTDFPHELSIAALLEAYAVIERDGEHATTPRRVRRREVVGRGACTRVSHADSLHYWRGRVATSARAPRRLAPPRRSP